MAEHSDFLYGTFPAGFAWSTATASYQIEGAWNKDGKGENIWDRFCHQPGRIENDDTGDVACDSYHKWEEDIRLIKELGTSHYRFSLSWSRILPLGTKEKINEAGVLFYDRFITALVTAGVTPVVTLYHFDLPQPLQDLGGWTNESLVEHFNDYANLCFSKFGDRVKHWITFNEPWVMCYFGLGMGDHAPGIRDPGYSPYKAGHTLLKSHARAYHTYNDFFRAHQKGQVGISLGAEMRAPKDVSRPGHVAAAERSLQFFLGWFANPIFGNGDYPDVMKSMIAKKSKEEGLSFSRLPSFTAREVEYIKGTYDFFGLNYYTSRYTEPQAREEKVADHLTDSDVKLSADPKWKNAKTIWLYSVPWGLRLLLNWIKDHYGNPPVYITENGWSDDGELQDNDRIQYFKDHINNVLKAIKVDECDVRGYTAWSLMDNFEWSRGYSEKFGLHHVDFNDPNRPRTPKASARFYAEVVKNNGFPNIEDQPNDNDIHVHEKITTLAGYE